LNRLKVQLSKQRAEPLTEIFRLKVRFLRKACFSGEPDETLTEYREHYGNKRGTHFSFLPAHKQPGVEWSSQKEIITFLLIIY